MAMTSIHNAIAIVITFALLCVACSRETKTSSKPEFKDNTPTLADSSNVEAEPKTADVLSYEQRQGKRLYMKYCAICHGTEGKGDGFNAFNLDPRPRDFTDPKYMNALSNSRLVETIMKGGRGVNRSVLMPTWSGRLNNDEVEYVVSFVRFLGNSKE